MELWVGNPLIETLFGLTSLIGAALLGWANLGLQPPSGSGVKSNRRPHCAPYR
jgi:hypothetical protein